MLRQMATIVRAIAADALEKADARAALREAAEVIRRGGLVAFPTETVYGLGANALNAQAVARIFAAKQRPSWDPLIVHIANWTMLERVAYSMSPRARSLMRAFWPGPLTLLLPRSPNIPDAVTAGRLLVGVRWPANAIAQALILAADTPIAAPSANLFGHVSPTTAAHVLSDLNHRIDMLLDGGATQLGLESAVVDPNTEPVTIYRPGIISGSDLRPIIGPVQMYGVSGQGPPPELSPSPGLQSRHYAPRTRLLLLASEAELSDIAKQLPDGKLPGIMLPAGWHAPAGSIHFDWGPWDKPRVLAERLYAGLRWLDEQRIDVILCPMPAATEETRALRDRLQKAARIG